MFVEHLIIGMVAIVVTVAIHAGFMVAASRMFRQLELRRRSLLQSAMLVAAVVLWFFLSICVQCWGWALFYLSSGALGTLEEALYFSTVTFTTLGYGDVVLSPEWRLLSAFQSANGTIIIGWTTAMVFLAVRWIYAYQDPDEGES